MPLPQYLDMEVPTEAQWSQVACTGTGSLARTAEAAYPQRGHYGLRLTSGDNGTASVEQALPLDWPPGGEVYVGLQLRPLARAIAGVPWLICLKDDEDGIITGLRQRVDGGLAPTVLNDDGDILMGAYTDPLALGRFAYVVVRLRRASAPDAVDGQAELFVDGLSVSRTSLLGNFLTAARLGHVAVGIGRAMTKNQVQDIDEVKIATEYPPPFTPAAGPAVDSGRLIVLYNRLASGATSFADACVEQLGISPAHCVGLTCPSEETLASYQDFHDQVEQPLHDYLQRNAPVRANARAFLLGWGVSGYFRQGGVLFSATSRLMNLDQAFDPAGRSNPFYRPSTLHPLSADELAAQGVYLAGRIDAPNTPAGLALALAALARVSGSVGQGPSSHDLLLSDQAAYLGSLSCQHLRLARAAMPAGAIAGDAFVWANSSAPNFAPAGGNRWVFVSTAANAGLSLRAGTPACLTAVSAGYQAAVASCGDAANLDVEAFFEMLRQGGSVGQAVLVATPRLGDSIVTCGVPTATIAFPRAGYNLYAGPSAGQIDYASPVAYSGLHPASITVPQPRQSLCRAYALRVVSAGGLEEQGSGALAQVELDGLGHLLAPEPVSASDITLTAAADGWLHLEWSLRPQGLLAWPEWLDVLGDNGTGQLDLDHPLLHRTDVPPTQRDYATDVHPAVRPTLLALRSGAAGRLAACVSVVVPPPVSAIAPVSL